MRLYVSHANYFAVYLSDADKEEPSIQIKNVSQDKAGTLPQLQFLEGIQVTPRRSEQVKWTPKEHSCYVGSGDLNKVLGIKMTSPKERKKQQMKAKYKK